jgi:hypothetical protein
MSRILRSFLILVVACAVSLALLLLIFNRGVDENMVPIHWAKLLITQDATAKVVQEWYGNNPPAWAMRLAVVWQRADPPSWWWLPILVILVSFVLSRIAKKRVRKL